MRQTYSQAKVEKEEDVEGHVDLQRKVFVEVLAGFYGTGEKKRNKIRHMTNTDEAIREQAKHPWLQRRGISRSLSTSKSPDTSNGLTSLTHSGRCHWNDLEKGINDGRTLNVNQREQQLLRGDSKMGINYSACQT